MFAVSLICKFLLRWIAAVQPNSFHFDSNWLPNKNTKKNFRIKYSWKCIFYVIHYSKSSLHQARWRSFPFFSGRCCHFAATRKQDKYFIKQFCIVKRFLFFLFESKWIESNEISVNETEGQTNWKKKTNYDSCAFQMNSIHS